MAEMELKQASLFKSQKYNLIVILHTEKRRHYKKDKSATNRHRIDK